MKLQDAKIIVNAMLEIKQVLDRYSKNPYKAICVDLETDEENSFFISSVLDFLELGIEFTVVPYPDPDYPLELSGQLDGVEIRCICTQQEYESHVKQ